MVYNFLEIIPRHIHINYYNGNCKETSSNLANSKRTLKFRLPILTNVAP